MLLANILWNSRLIIRHFQIELMFQTNLCWYCVLTLWNKRYYLESKLLPATHLWPMSNKSALFNNSSVGFPWTISDLDSKFLLKVPTFKGLVIFWFDSWVEWEKTRGHGVGYDMMIKMLCQWPRDVGEWLFIWKVARSNLWMSWDNVGGRVVNNYWWGALLVMNLYSCSSIQQQRPAVVPGSSTCEYEKQACPAYPSIYNLLRESTSTLL